MHAQQIDTYVCFCVVLFPMLQLNDWVVCKLFYKEGAGCTNTESMQGEEDMQPQMVPAAHLASDYSERDLCVEDYLVCDVGFAQEKDAANCTI
jgi:hypothetical protein